MTERNDSQTSVTVEEILKTELIINQALIDILIAKQIISEDELVCCIRKIRQEQHKKIGESLKIVTLKR